MLSENNDNDKADQGDQVLLKSTSFYKCVSSIF